jgi:hypothetical protein
LRLGDALGGQGRDRGLDEAPELDDVSERVAARDEARERTRQIVRRGLTDEGSAAGARLDDAEKLERPQCLTDRSARDLKLLGELSLGRELVAWAQVALLEETFDLLDDALVEAAASDRLNDSQAVTSPRFWSGGLTNIADEARTRWPRRQRSTESTPFDQPATGSGGTCGVIWSDRVRTLTTSSTRLATPFARSSCDTWYLMSDSVTPSSAAISLLDRPRQTRSRTRTRRLTGIEA